MSKKDLTITPPSLLDLANDVKQPVLKELIYDFLQRFDLTRVNSFKDLARGYQGLLAAQICMASLGPNYCAAFDSMRKTLDSYGKAMKEYIHSEWPEEAKALFLQILEEHFAGKLSHEEMAAVKEALDLEKIHNK